MSGPTYLSASQIPAAPRSSMSSRCRDYQRVADTLAWISAHFEEQPTLADIASRAGASSCHFQRLFSRWVGMR